MLLPLEIFELIIDAVSAERPISKLMKTCSLVCHHFHSRARIYLFSQIILWVGIKGECQKRASKFLRILRFKKNSDLISHIRSVQVLLYLHPWHRGSSKVDPIFGPGSNGLLKLMGVDTNPIKTALSMFKNASIEELALKGAYGNQFPCTQTSGTTILLEICSNPNLKTLCFDNIKCLPSRFIWRDSHGRSLSRLALHGVTIGGCCIRSQPPVVVPTEVRPTEVETLELLWMASRQNLQALHCLYPPSKSACFQNLKNLVFTLPQWDSETEKMWNIILGAAETLESLELRLSM